MLLSFLPLLPQMVLAGLSHGTCPTVRSSLRHRVSSGVAGPQVTPGAWEQLEPLGKVFLPPHGNGQHHDGAKPKSLFLRGASLKLSEEGGRACLTRAQLPAAACLCLPPPSSSDFHVDHKHF